MLETTKATVEGALALDISDPGFTVAVGPLEVVITGQTALDVDLVVENQSTESLSFDIWLGGLTADLTGDQVNCGSVDVNPDPDVTDDKALTGRACARLDLDVDGPVGTLGFRAEDITADGSLVLRRPDGSRVVIEAGEVTLRAP